jgi:hypothetical protein
MEHVLQSPEIFAGMTERAEAKGENGYEKNVYLGCLMTIAEGECDGRL